MKGGIYSYYLKMMTSDSGGLPPALLQRGAGVSIGTQMFPGLRQFAWSTGIVKVTERREKPSGAFFGIVQL